MNRMLISNLHSTRLNSAHGQHTFSLKFDSFGQNYVSKIFMRKTCLKKKQHVLLKGRGLLLLETFSASVEDVEPFLPKTILKRGDAFENKN